MNRIVFQETIQIDDRWFKRQEQYAYTGTIMKQVDCKNCSINYKYKQMKHYQIDFDGVIYDIPEYAVVEYDKDIDPLFVDKQTYLEKKFSDNITDYRKETMELLGIDTTPKIDYSVGYIENIQRERQFFASTNASRSNKDNYKQDKEGDA